MLISTTPVEGERLLSPEPDQFCAICNGKVPKVVAPCWSRNGRALTPDAGGWMHVLFPFPTLAQRSDAWNFMSEARLICPPCAGEVAKFIAHRRVPMLSDEDTIG